MITAKIVADSISEAGKRITTFELEYPRFIHAEFMTHRVVSKNSASSRAIPLNTMIKQVLSNMAMPVHWGQTQAGMQAKSQLPFIKKCLAKGVWRASGVTACGFAWLLSKIGLHKQVANRILEPWSHSKIVATATEWDNFFWLRNHPDAQPEFNQLAKEMWVAYSTNQPVLLKEGEWHLPYISLDDLVFSSAEKVSSDQLTLEEAKKVSASMCAQVSYRKSDETLSKAMTIYDRLVDSVPVHASPFEHQATPLADPKQKSGNLTGWFQYRQEIPNNVCHKYPA